jgi:anthranilate/para-aminobenzoate synthase component II
VLQQAVDTPILGVCLGHEGLAIAHGAKVSDTNLQYHQHVVCSVDAHITVLCCAMQCCIAFKCNNMA